MLLCEGMSGVRRWLTLATGLLECLGFAGAVFGWASLVFVLKTDNYFSYLCVNATGPNATQIIDCSGQDEQFSLIFTIASFMLNFLLLPNGFLFDRFGTMVTRILGISLYTTGALLVAFSSSDMSVLLYPALSFIAVGGILFLVTNMQVGNLFGSHRSTIITLYNGAFQSSSALFFIIKLVFEADVSLRASFLFLASCGVIHLVRTFLLLPRKHIPYPLPEGYTYGLTCGQSKTFSPTETYRMKHTGTHRTEANGNVQNDATAEHRNEERTSKDEQSFRNCVLSRFFLWQLVWMSVMHLRHLLYIGTLNPMLQRLTLGEPSLVSTYTNAFAFTQLCGVLCAPWNGLIMDRLKGKPRAPGESERESDLRASVLSLFLTALQCVLFSVCASTPVLPLQYLTFILQVLNRSFLYGGNAAFISIAFPSCHFGKLYGLIMALSAVVSLLQYPCFILVQDVLEGEPLYVNIALTLLTLTAFIQPLCVYLHCHRLVPRGPEPMHSPPLPIEPQAPQQRDDTCLRSPIASYPPSLSQAQHLRSCSPVATTAAAQPSPDTARAGSLYSTSSSPPSPSRSGTSPPRSVPETSTRAGGAFATEVRQGGRCFVLSSCAPAAIKHCSLKGEPDTETTLRDTTA